MVSLRHVQMLCSSELMPQPRLGLVQLSSNCNLCSMPPDYFKAWILCNSTWKVERNLQFSISSLASPLKAMFTPPLPIYQFNDNIVSSRSSANSGYIYSYPPMSLLFQHRKELALSVKKWKEKHTPMEVIVVTKTRQSIKQRLQVNDI